MKYNHNSNTLRANGINSSFLKGETDRLGKERLDYMLLEEKRLRYKDRIS